MDRMSAHLINLDTASEYAIVHPVDDYSQWPTPQYIHLRRQTNPEITAHNISNKLLMRSRQGPACLCGSSSNSTYDQVSGPNVVPSTSVNRADSPLPSAASNCQCPLGDSKGFAYCSNNPRYPTNVVGRRESWYRSIV